ncbi:MAG: hypothetical protein K6U78_11570 [Anaerolineae bacterium]|nr:hypothetical protein [Anaerolineae bacterium]
MCPLNRYRPKSVIGQCQSLRCDAYDIARLVEALREALDPHREAELVFNLTGGTKAMVLAANQVALQHRAQVVYLESEHIQNVLYEYCYDDRQNLKFLRRTELPGLISIAQFLDAHIGKGKWKEMGPSKDSGGSFEQAVANALTAKLPPPPQAEVAQGIRFLGSQDGKRPQADLDMVVRCGNQFARIECKSQGKTTTLDALKQLNMVTELLGTYTRKFIAMSGSPNPDHAEVYQATRTQVVELLSFDGKRLSDEDQAKLANKIAEAIGCRSVDAPALGGQGIVGG